MTDQSVVSRARAKLAEHEAEIARLNGLIGEHLGEVQKLELLIEWTLELMAEDEPLFLAAETLAIAPNPQPVASPAAIPELPERSVFSPTDALSSGVATRKDAVPTAPEDICKTDEKYSDPISDAPDAPAVAEVAARSVASAPVSPASAPPMPETGEAGANASPKPQSFIGRVREYVAAHPDATANDVALALGVDVVKVRTNAAASKIVFRKLTPEERGAAHAKPHAKRHQPAKTQGAKAKSGHSPWTEDGISLLRDMAADGATPDEIAKAVSQQSGFVVNAHGVVNAAHFHKVTLQKAEVRQQSRDQDRKTAAQEIHDRAEQLKRDARERLGEAPAKPAAALGQHASPFAPVGGDDQPRIIRKPKGRLFWLRNSEGLYLDRYCSNMTRDRRYAWVGTEAQLVGCRRNYAIARELREHPVEKEAVRA